MDRRFRPLRAEAFGIGVAACLGVLGLSSFLADVTRSLRGGSARSEELLAIQGVQDELKVIDTKVGAIRPLGGSANGLMSDSATGKSLARVIRATVDGSENPFDTSKKLFNIPELAGAFSDVRRFELREKLIKFDELRHQYQAAMLDVDHDRRRLDELLRRQDRTVTRCGAVPPFAPGGPSFRPQEVAKAAEVIERLRHFSQEVRDYSARRSLFPKFSRAILEERGPGDRIHVSRLSRRARSKEAEQRIDGFRLVPPPEVGGCAEGAHRLSSRGRFWTLLLGSFAVP